MVEVHHVTDMLHTLFNMVTVGVIIKKYYLELLFLVSTLMFGTETRVLQPHYS